MVTIIDGNICTKVDHQPNQLLSDILDLHTDNLHYPCGKQGFCKKCTVAVSGDISPKTDQELSLPTGYRLACLTRVLGDCTVTLSTTVDIAKFASTYNITQDINPEICGLAVDIGTTTVAVNLIHSGSRYSHNFKNPQTKFGADVISRIQQSMSGQQDNLANILITELNTAITKLCRDSKTDSTQLKTCVITGNTVMLHLLTKRDCTPLAKAPFTPNFYGDVTVTPAEIGLEINPQATVYLPPCFGGFVGADITTAIIASGMTHSSKTSVLVDIGTNGEMALWHNGRLTVTSTAAGPAFEGVGIHCGVYGIPGAIDHVDVNFAGDNFEISTIENKKPVGICGSGVVDCLATLLTLEALDETGRLEDEDERFDQFITEKDYDIQFNFAENVYISGKDIRTIQLAKSAICSGIITLLKDSSISYDQVDFLYIAGGFGSFINLEKAGQIGLLPPELIKKSVIIGNGALIGAEEMLLDTSYKPDFMENFKLLDLATSKIFMNEYVNNMFFKRRINYDKT